MKWRRPSADRVTRPARLMAKPELIAHLERDHSRAVSTPIVGRRWTMDALTDFHRRVHIGLGSGADHEHRTPPWTHE